MRLSVGGLCRSAAGPCGLRSSSAVYERIGSRGYPDLDARLAMYGESHDDMFWPSLMDAIPLVLPR